MYQEWMETVPLDGVTLEQRVRELENKLDDKKLRRN